MSRYWGYSQRPANWKELLQEVVIPEKIEVVVPEKPEVEVPEKPEVVIPEKTEVAIIPEKFQDDTPMEQPKTDSSSTYL